MKILLTHTPANRAAYYGDRALAALRELGEVHLHEGAEALAPQQLIAAAQGMDVAVVDRLTTGPAEIFAHMPSLKAFLRCAVDIRNIDVAAASAAGVLVTRATPGFVNSVTELGIGFLVDLSRGISRATAAYHQGQPQQIHTGRQLAGSTLGIVGYGVIGRQLAHVAHAMGMTVLIDDPYVRLDDPRFTQLPFNDVLARADFIVSLALATEETENLFNAAAFARMQPGSCFINLSRGNLVDEEALAAALNSGHLSGAAMDVGRAPDQMPSPALAALPNVIATPHIGGLTPQAIEHQAMDTVAQVAALVRGEVPPGAVNAGQWTRRISAA